MKKIILIGRSGAGRTTLTQALKGEEIKYHKTQYVNYFGTHHRIRPENMPRPMSWVTRWRSIPMKPGCGGTSSGGHGALFPVSAQHNLHGEPGSGWEL